MRILKGLYVCWVVVLVVGWFISPMIAHNPDRVEEFFIMLGLIVFPAMVANLVLFVIKRAASILILSFRSYFVFRSRLVCKDFKMKKAIDNLKDYAELAWASYFNFMYINGQKVDNYKIR